MLAHQGKGERLDDFGVDPGRTAYMSSNSPDWQTLVVKVDNSTIKSQIKVPHRKVFQENDENVTASRVNVCLSDYFRDIPKCAELQRRNFTVRCIETKTHKRAAVNIVFNDGKPATRTMLSVV
jgi:hypothetical protein